MKVTVETDYLEELDSTSAIVLTYLKEKPMTTPEKLTEIIHRDKTTVYPILLKLEDYGYIKRIYEKNKQGGRPVIVGAEVLI